MDSNPPTRSEHWELTWWKKVQLGTLFESYFYIAPKQTIKSDQALFWEVVDAVRRADVSYKLVRVVSESTERRG